MAVPQECANDVALWANGFIVSSTGFRGKEKDTLISTIDAAGGS